MERIIYHLGNRTTWQAILKTIPNLKKFSMQEKQGDAIPAEELEHESARRAL